jgi:hypothetical protein
MLDNETLYQVESILKMGTPLTVIAKTLNIPLASIEHLRNEKANNND